MESGEKSSNGGLIKGANERDGKENPTLERQGNEAARTDRSSVIMRTSEGTESR